MECITITGVTKTYTEKAGVRTEALKGINLTVQEGEFMSIAGPSGSGKTTLGKMILGVLRPDSGEVKRYTDKIQVIFPGLGENVGK